MRKVLLTLSLAVILTGGVFAQKSNVKAAERIAKKENADFKEAESLIDLALKNPETMNSAKTWYVAGFIQNQKFDAENVKQVLGKKANEEVMYKALGESIPYFMKAIELDNMPNEKGKIKPRYTKKIKDLLVANHVYLINAGAHYFDKQEYEKAYGYFDKYLNIKKLEIFKDEAIAQPDSQSMQIGFFAAVAASQFDRQKALEIYNEIKNVDYRQVDVYQYLAYEYLQDKDTVSYMNTLEEGMAKFPDESYFRLNLINMYIFTGKIDQAINSLEKAIELEPNKPELYDVLGSVYEADSPQKDLEKAESYYRKALEINPEYKESIANLGRIYYNKALEVQSNPKLDRMTKKEYEVEIQKAQDLFRKALPFFEKAHKLDSEESQYRVALRGIYYNLNMGPELEAIEKEMGVN